MDQAISGTSETWIAIEPPARRPSALSPPFPDSLNPHPPSFASSQFDIILRRQRHRNGLKLSSVPSRFLNLSNDFEFAGWGSLSRIKLSLDDYAHGEATVKQMRDARVLGQWTASALAGNAVLGGVFYALPAVVAVAGVYSPISLFTASLTLFLWRPIMEELCSALPISGAPYTFLINVSTKTLALVGAVLLILDFAATSVVSAATATSYLAGEVNLPFPPWIGVIFVFALFTAISLSGVKESARIALAVLTFHMMTMTALMIASAVQWVRVGNRQLTENWVDNRAISGKDIMRQLFYGFCIGMLSLTGFECTTAYISVVIPGTFPLVLRNLHIPAILLNCTIVLFVLALIPLERVLEGANVLSVLAEITAGKWLRVWIVVDAIIVLCGGVLTGILSACELLHQLSLDCVIPRIFLRTLPWTRAPYLSVLSFIGFCSILYASAGARLAVVSKMFSLVWLTVMTLFPLSLLLLKFNRGRLPRAPNTPLRVIFSAFAVAAAVFAGNIALDPDTAVYFAAYFVTILLLFLATQHKSRLLHYAYWTYDQIPIMHSWRVTAKWDERLTGTIQGLRKQDVAILVASDEIHYLFRMILYVRQNEDTSCLKIIHFYDVEKGAGSVPDELEANAKILDEGFPEITIDLVLVPAAFTPTNVAALAHHLQIPRSLMFMSCPGSNFNEPVVEFGTRIITM